MNNKRLQIIIALSCALVLLPAITAWANVPATGALDQIESVYINGAAQWENVLHGYAVRMFWLLALIDFVWMAINLAINPGEFSDISANLIRKIIFIGFFYALLIHGPDWAGDIIASFRVAANTVVPATIGSRPSDIFDAGFRLAIKIFDAISITHPVDSLGFVIAGYIIMAVFALIAAMVLLVFIQAYIVLYAGIILLGFGGCTFTKDIALNYFKGALSVGAKLFIMLLVARLGMAVVNSWASTFVHITFKQLCLFIGSAIVLLALVKAIPDMVGDMINGFSWGAGESLTRTGMRTAQVAGGAAIGAAAGAAGGFMAVREAAKLSGTSNGATGMMGRTASTVGNLGKAAAQDLVGRISGAHQGQGTAGGRMAASLKEQRLSTGAADSQPKDEPYISNVPSNGNIQG